MSSEATQGQTPDLYGQLHPVETPELVHKQRAEFEAQVTLLPPDKTVNLMQAQSKCPELLTDDFKLYFLRCEVFNAHLAAKRYADYWDKRVEIFGPEKAFMPLTLNGALRDDSVALEMQFITLIPHKDETGRSIIFMDPSKQDKTKYSRESMCRAMWYMTHAALEDETTQKKGIVLLAYPHKAKLSQFDRGLMKMNIESIKGCIPVRASAFHFCHPPAFVSLILPIAKLFMGERMRKRLQLHSGSEEKVLGHIARYGLPKAAMPTELGGDVVIDHLAWLQSRRAAGK